MRISLLLLLFYFVSNQASAQTLRLYDWYSLQSYRAGIDVTETPNYVVYNSVTGLVFFNKNDEQDIQHFTKIDGLTGSDIQKVIYNEEATLLFIYYIDGSIDLMDQERKVTSIQDIKNNNVLVPNKEASSLYSSGRYIYICLPFGMVEYDAVARVFTNTLTVQGGVTAVAIRENDMYIANNGNLYTINRLIKPNISFIGNWSLMNDPAQDSQNTINYNGLCLFRDQIFTTWKNNLYNIDGSSFVKRDTLLTISSVKYLYGGNKYLMAGGACNPANLDNKSCMAEVVIFNEALQQINYNRSGINDNQGLLESNDRIWLADSYHGYRYLNTADLSPGIIDLNERSPWSNHVVSMIKTPEKLYVGPGGYSQIYAGNFNLEGLFEYDGKWTIRNLYNDGFFGAPNTIYDISSFAYNENTGELAMGSYVSGIISIKGETRKKYNDENSALQTAPGDPNATRVGDLAFDRDGNLWATNVLSPTSIYVRNPEGKDMGFKNNFGELKLIQLTIDPVNNFKWAVDPSKGIVVYDSGDNLLSAADDRWKIVSVYSDFEKQNILPRCVYSDSDGRIWIGTVSGVFVLDCGSEIFETNNDCQTRFPYIQDANGIGAFLNGQTVNVITEDGAGRKWFGTNSGIYVTNPSVDEVVLQLNAVNSPLADDNVTSLEIDKKEGVVYIGTRSGIQMYKTDASIGNTFHDAKLTIYPNPVQPSYDGPIVIQGLAHDSSVKIADISGKLVFETQSLGGQAIWYGKDLSGNKVGSGVYSVLGTTTLNLENPTGIIGKIIYIK